MTKVHFSCQLLSVWRLNMNLLQENGKQKLFNCVKSCSIISLEGIDIFNIAIIFQNIY